MSPITRDESKDSSSEHLRGSNPRLSDSVFVRAPVLHGFLDRAGREIFGGGLTREFHELDVRSEPEPDDLPHCDARIEQPASEREVPEIFFGANGPVLHFEGKIPGENE